MYRKSKAEALARKAAEDFFVRSRSGSLIHPLCLLLAGGTTGLIRTMPSVIWTAEGLFVFMSVLRLVTVRRIRVAFRDNTSSRNWHSLYRLNIGLVLACAFLWSMITGISMMRFGYYDPAVLQLLLYHAAIAIGTVLVLAHDRRLIMAAMLLVFAPSLLGNVLHGDRDEMSYVPTALLYCGYCLAQGFELHKRYLQEIAGDYALSVAAHRDPLTGLINRLGLNEVLDQAVEQADQHGRQIALLYIDLDGFKQINDQHSHEVGDRFLCVASRRMAACVRQDDMVARVGGDEFVILLRGEVSMEKASQLAERVLTSAREPVAIEGANLHYSASIGVSVYPVHADSKERLMRAADEAMYSAKYSGKNQICSAPCVVEALG
jgi:diguanylate cyclase (GGDEF)-like protein